MKIFEQNMGDLVLCDLCNKNYTDSNMKGGFIFGSKAVCPICGPTTLKSIKRYKEEDYIQAFCPEKMTFPEFVRQYRGGDGKIEIHTL